MGKLIIAACVIVASAVALIVTMGGESGEGANERESPRSANNPPGTEATRVRPKLQAKLAESAGRAPSQSSSEGASSTADDTPKTQADIERKNRATVTNELMRLNRADFAMGNYEDVLVRAEAVLAEEPGRGMARAYAAMAACQLGNKDKAQTHADELSEQHFQLVQKRCGLELKDSAKARRLPGPRSGARQGGNGISAAAPQ